MHHIQNFAVFLAIAVLGGCSTIEPKPNPGAEQEIVVVRVPVFVIPNCNLPRPATCQWLEPPARGAGLPQLQGPLPVKGIAL